MTHDRLGSFPTSRWSQIDRARGDRSSLRREALGSLVNCYLPPLRAHLVLRMRIERSLAEVLVNDFVQDKIMQRDFLSHAEPGKGKFRSFLLRSLQNYVIDQLRRETKHTGPQLDMQDPEFAHLAAVDAPADEFDVAWTRQVLNQALERMRAECDSVGRAAIWQVFEYRVLRPTLLGTSPPSYDQFARQFGFAGPEQASNALITAKRQFSRVLKSVVGEYVPEDEVEQELADLRACLAKLGPLGVVIPRDLTNEAGDVLSSIVDAPDAARASPSSELAPIAQMLSVSAQRDALWDPEDLAQLLRAQLAAPLTALLPDLDKLLGRDERLADDPPEPAPTSPAELFQHPRPPLPVLEAMKRRAREGTRDQNSALPSDVWTVLYFASIAAALVHCNARISKSSNETLYYGFQCVLEFPWLTEPLRSMVATAASLRR